MSETMATRSMRSICSIRSNILILLLIESCFGSEYGNIWTKPCLRSASDKGSNFESSNNLIDQAQIWSNYDGYYLYEQYFYDEDMEPHYFGPGSDGVENATTVRYFPAIGFANFTIDGSRVYKHNYLIFPGLDGTSSVASAQDSWGTSRSQMDGSTTSLGGLLGFYTKATQLYGVGQMVHSVVDNRTIHGRGFTQGGLFEENDVVLTETIFCLDDECSQMSITQQKYRQESAANMNRTMQSVLNLRKVSEIEWIEKVRSAMIQYDVIPEHRIQVPMVKGCLTEDCESFLTEEWWCEADPKCNKSLSNGEENSYKTEITLYSVIIILTIIVTGQFILLLRFYSEKQLQQYALMKKFGSSSLNSASQSTLSLDSDCYDSKLLDLREEEDIF